ncbi:MAG: NAD(P)H-dependent oxidoreductase subunit E [Streptosporangiaceae bacterium]|jgi:NADH:ubiquinone oxidoreductase subunit F (NADH-binding)
MSPAENRFDPIAARAVRRGRAADGLLDAVRATAGGTGPDHDAIARIAGTLGLPRASVRGPATFFADLAAPHGRRHVRVCTAAACFAARSGAHLAEAERALGVTAGHGNAQVSLQQVRCLGFCYAGPACLDGDQPNVGADLAAQLAGLARPVAPPIPVSSAVDEPVVLAGIVAGRPAWRQWPRVARDGSRDEIVAQVAASGMCGRGGAGFPVARKWNAVSGATGVVVIANGDEGDPGSYADRLLMEEDPDRVLEGLALACFATGARRGVVLVRSEYPLALARMRAAVLRAREAGHLGSAVHGGDVDLDIDIAEGVGSYVTGEETALIAALEGKRGTVRRRPPYPTSQGLWDAPTVVNNVETLAAVPWIVERGGAAYARLGTEAERGTKLVCLSERFARPGCYEVQLGAPLRWIVEDLGGGLRDGGKLIALQVGGPLGGFIGADDLDITLTEADLARRGAALGHAGLVAFDERVSGTALLRHAWGFAAEESCGACSPCRVGSRRGPELVRGEPTGEYRRLLQVMQSASLCAFGRRVPPAVRSLARLYPELSGWM